MHKPLQLPLRVRFWHLLRGLLFYNTVYWKRASDDVKLPRLSRRERQALQPVRNLEIIRPRERPRARLAAAHGAQVSEPTAQTAPTAPVASAAPAEPTADDSAGTKTRAPAVSPAAPAPVPGEEGLVVKRRRYRRRRPGAHASHFVTDPATDPGAGLFQRMFKRGRER